MNKQSRYPIKSNFLSKSEKKISIDHYEADGPSLSSSSSVISKNDLSREKIINKIKNLIDNKLSYNKNIKICTFIKNKSMIVQTIKDMLFSTNLYFIVKIKKSFGVFNSVYVEFFDKDVFDNSALNLYHNAYEFAKKKNSTNIVLEKNILLKDKLIAECKTRNYNMALDMYSHKFIYDIYCRKVFVVDDNVVLKKYKIYAHIVD
ncbi:hypothetical protein QJ850_gp632 [Acanthamoeba polyphaga mimivirus]|uniref:Uncharacterized protein n=1 Tax=Acanthamoeba polyphaga mimivirus Kroon TaxID=3069720 RepID=A0A0G2Y8F2_9VIRU|nr:hypothetical protein QJ850_gp632 [Acanthamoeba polyphaga mimivirus]AKI80067.1 hypothetical protein [Acanthamoeba polyphaga mimivirus Kroon]